MTPADPPPFGARAAEAEPLAGPQSSQGRWRSQLAYLGALSIVIVCTAIGLAMSRVFAPMNIVMVYLLGVVAVASWFGRGPSIFASILGMAAFDFFFIPPHLTFAVEDTQYIVTFAVMLVTGIIIGTLTSRISLQAEAALFRERRTAALYALARELAGLEDRTAIAKAAARSVANALDAKVCVLLPDESDHLQLETAQADGSARCADESATAAWVFKHGEMAGLGTTIEPGAPFLYLPLRAAHGTVGVIGARPVRDQLTFDPVQVHLLETFASMTAVAIERAQLASIAQQNLMLVETERLRSSLLSAMSHDLRTPLAAIAGASSTLVEADGMLSQETRQELAESIYDEAERLNRLVANLLDMTRLEGGAMTVRKEWQPIEEIIGVVLNRLSRQLSRVEFTTHFDPDLPLVPLDDLLIQQVLMNLLENALRFTPPGGSIELNARADGQELTIEVADRGPGLKPGEEQRVFDKFYRGDRSRSHHGAGLGLTICRGIVELHGGRISAENRSGGGALFRFTLPLLNGPPALALIQDDAVESEGY